ncbi:hypothetical protein HYH02_000524 [Chlamydomonas schloesseri]|uniref:Prolyl 4-hydroxylase alpha subunit domain-containing protein n=1 Tax=Chlamydomonas schloesseri TaxID=2026947 RepID=A0A836BCR7_9CHLO|nr:hypothetical protein HYH02_000524 [Chlamydomonas schloesseri]|eukprot:KAG2454686.1 hypothetical protein HYH02_000524 [Chlamydomonas schloesseri]
MAQAALRGAEAMSASGACPIASSRRPRTAAPAFRPSPPAHSNYGPCISSGTPRGSALLRTCAAAPQSPAPAPAPHSGGPGPEPSGSGAAAADAVMEAVAAQAADAAALVGAAWDPEGLFAKAGGPLNFAAGQQMGDLILRRQREREARMAAVAAAAAVPAATAAPAAAAAPVAAAAVAVAAPATTGDVTPVPPLPAGLPPMRPLPVPVPSPELGLAPSELPAAVVAEAEALLRERFMGVDLATPGLRLLHLDPPVLTVDGFLPDHVCDAMIAAAEASGRMVGSRIGAGNASAAYGPNAASARRTSRGMMVTPGVAGPAMDGVVSELHTRGKKLLRAGEGPAWGISGKLPRPRQYCYEALQVTRYDAGQHFLAHEDGFPPHIAASNAFQRHATLLVYLNDCPQGGATRFDQLGLAVRPKKGKLLLFFPAFADGSSDPRSLHTACDAVDIKYVTQQWVARGLALPGSSSSSSSASTSGGGGAKTAGATAAAVSAEARQAEARLEGLERAKAGKGKAGGKAAGGKGFGKK